MLLGPLTLLLDSCPVNQAWGAGLTVICLVAFATAVARPRQETLAFAYLAAVLWLIVGWLGVGINC